MAEPAIKIVRKNAEFSSNNAPDDWLAALDALFSLSGFTTFDIVL
jgi:hypothetical protein